MVESRRVVKIAIKSARGDASENDGGGARGKDGVIRPTAVYVEVFIVGNKRAVRDSGRRHSGRGGE